MELDTTDSQIIQLLQKDGRMSNADLAAQIHRSESACHRRVRQLENAGVIERYTAVINQAAIGKPANIFVEITLASMGEDTLNAFEEAVRACDDVVTCFFMTGDADYLLHIAAANTEDYERIYRTHLSRFPGIARIRSSFALRVVSKT
jgi:Lrp/AsnC family leucine-responsive transcriptional regulator